MHIAGFPINAAILISLFTMIIFQILSVHRSFGYEIRNNKILDKRVQKFLESRKGTWHDLNVPYDDGKVLYDLVLKNGYKKALEIGTSTGLSTIWIALALSKTGVDS
jgi:predicted O-methyltransferase YrrM